jgi:nucleoside-diphosphate-sugar epimerase
MQHREAYRNRRILITGGAGCIGSNLTRALAEAGAASVVVLDDLSAAVRWNVPDAPAVRFVEGSVLDTALLAQLFSEKPDYVFHLAALFANQNSVDHPEDDLMVNGMGTLRVLEHCRQRGVERVVYASSGCSVYGSQAPLPLTEDYVSIMLDTPYQITKLLGELYCNFFHSFYGVPTVRARFFNVYGPGEVPGRYRNVIPNFIYWSSHGAPVPITGTGGETRDFTFVEDIVEGLLACGVLPEAIGDAFNLASGQETSVNQIVGHLERALNRRVDLVRTERRKWDRITRRRASIEKAQRMLGYQPHVNMEQGIRETVAWFGAHRDQIEREVERRGGMPAPVLAAAPG